MADQKISELTPAAGALLPDDSIPLARGTENFRGGPAAIVGGAMGLIAAMSGVFIQ